MTKLRKQQRRKSYRHNVNRKRLRNRMFSLGNIKCKEIKQEWESKKSFKTNLKEMGLSYDPNKTIKIPNTKKQLRASLVSNKDEWNEQIITEPEKTVSHVAQSLEKYAKIPREWKFRIPKNHVEYLSYLIVKYGNDYKAMAKDSKNYNQETWKKIRQRILRFRSIPEQFNTFLEESGLSSINFDIEQSDGEF